MTFPTFSSFFSPWSATIASIVPGLLTTINTLQATNYGVGLQVRIVIPLPCGMQELNNQQVSIIKVLSPTSFLIGINSLTFDVYVRTGNDVYIGQVIPISEPATTLEFANINDGTIIPEIYGTPPTPNYP